ncbi:cellulose-binding protein [Ligilactobacillus agilis]|uniref:Cellulose-binding protein n=1 Tax=Ligilactobacillus agilis TaxID=1601 RepID=A0A6F9XJT4_9LACO|nr:fibronectin type III domain-containing protein [Ligilactobacillus agilis]GET05420.1 cellulose-binding protein [Ligilactobacillus agilis]
MSTYAMKDAANITLIDKATGEVVLHTDYANATSTEWQSERVYAKKKNVNAVAFDASKTATLTLETELFDLKLLSVIMGSNLEEGETDLFKKERLTVSATKQLKLSMTPVAGSISVFRLQADGISHAGKEVPAQITGEGTSVPTMPADVSVTAKDTSAVVSWTASKGADTYVIFRDGAQVGTVTKTTFTDTDLTPEKEYVYTVKAINVNGQSPLSAQVVITTAAAGTEVAGSAVTATEEAKQAAQAAATMDEATGINYVLKENGVIQLSDAAVAGDRYVVYYMTHVNRARTITISADKFPKSYELYADAYLREAETGADEFMQIHYHNVRPQSNFTFQQSAAQSTNLSVRFDIFPNADNEMAEYKVIA